MIPCRLVFPGKPVFLRMQHVLKAWAEQLRRKLKLKDRFHEAYGMLQRIAGMQIPAQRKKLKM